MARSLKPSAAKSEEHRILVYADWAWLKQRPALMGSLYASSVRGSEVFSFEYDGAWLKGTAAQILDPELSFFGGRQYAKAENFGLFMDSSPDRWGRTVMQRREALEAKAEGRGTRTLTSSDYLLGVADAHRAGALRFKRAEDGPFLDDRVPADHPSPPIATIRELEAASEEIERGGRIEKLEHVQLLLAPGGSLGGSRPKSGVVNTDGSLWIAKFPSRNDTYDMGAWEEVVLLLAKECGIVVSEGYSRKFSGKWRSFLTKRFDRTSSGDREHFASAMTLLGRKDGDGADSGVSYLDMVQLLTSQGAQANTDLPQLWRRIAFNVCVSNVDDHLRNHGFLLTPNGWALTPAYDMNAVPHAGRGLSLNIDPHSNALDLDLVLSVAGHFRVGKDARAIAGDIAARVAKWRTAAERVGLGREEREQMSSAFQVAEAFLKRPAAASTKG